MPELTSTGTDDGDPASDTHDRLFAEVYAELSAMARRLLGGRQRTTLDTVALVHELYLKLNLPPAVQDRTAFMALAGKAMRHVLIDHLRERGAAKRGGDWQRVTFASRELGEATQSNRWDLLGLERCLALLESLDPRYVTLIECRFFAGMENAEIASLLGISTRSVQRDWRRARAFLQMHLARDDR